MQLFDKLFLKDSSFLHIQAATTFCKTYLIFFYPSSKIEINLSIHAKETYITEKECEKIYTIISNYYKEAEKLLVRTHLKIQKTEKQNMEMLISKGSVNTEKEERFQKVLLKFEKFKQNVLALSMAAMFEFPELVVEKVENVTIGVVMERNENSTTPGLGIWDDEEMKDFYENVLDLSNLVPAVLLGAKKKWRKIY